MDVAIRRWQKLTGKDAVHAETRLTWTETAKERGVQIPGGKAPTEKTGTEATRVGRREPGKKGRRTKARGAAGTT